VAQIGDPKQLFVHKLGATLTMEETVLSMLEELEQKANDAELKEQLSHHHDETRQQVANLEQAFSAIGVERRKQPCPAIEGLQVEGKELLQQAAQELYDAVILGGCAEVEHHEIAVYDGLIQMADEMGEEDIVALLKENLEQEEHTLKEVEKAFKKETKKLAERIAA
jgi:ferritin-like metal-binding protein YciE